MHCCDTYHNVIHTCWCAGKLHKELMNTAATYSAAEMHRFEAQSMANMIWAFATLAHPPLADFMEALCSHALQELHTFQPQNISNTVWALATLNYTDQVSYLLY